MRLFTPTKEWLDRVRTGSASARALRGVIAASVALLAVLCSVFLWAGPEGTLFACGALVVAGLWAVAQPDGIGPLATFVILGLWWWFGGWDASWWLAAACGLLALVFHLACAWAATAPMHSDFAPGMRRHMLRAGAGQVAAGAAAMAVAAGAARLPVPGAVVWVALATTAVLALGVALAMARGRYED